jgi:hypothetical protein
MYSTCLGLIAVPVSSNLSAGSYTDRKFRWQRQDASVANSLDDVLANLLTKVIHVFGAALLSDQGIFWHSRLLPRTFFDLFRGHETLIDQRNGRISVRTIRATKHDVGERGSNAWILPWKVL